MKTYEYSYLRHHTVYLHAVCHGVALPWRQKFKIQRMSIGILRVCGGVASLPPGGHTAP